MMRVLAGAALLLPALLADDSVSLVLRGKTQSLVRMQSSGSGANHRFHGHQINCRREQNC